MSVSNRPRRSIEPLATLLGIVDDVRLAWRLFIDRRVPFWVKGIPFITAAYVIWPLDILPDLMPALGQVDDLTIIVLGILLFIKLCPPDLVSWHRENIAGRVPTPSGPPHDVVEASYRVLDKDQPEE